MQKNKLNLHIYGIHLLNPYKTVVSHLKCVEVVKIIGSGHNQLDLIKLGA